MLSCWSRNCYRYNFWCFFDLWSSRLSLSKSWSWGPRWRQVIHLHVWTRRHFTG